MNFLFDLKQIMIAIDKSNLLNFLLRLSNKSLFLGALAITLTNRCNFRCSMCTLLEDIAQKSKENEEIFDIDIIYIKNLLSDISNNKFIKPKIHFIGGGEPLFYKNFNEIIVCCNDQNLKWSITTNAYLLNNFYKQIIESKCDRINISIHGIEKIHNEIVDVKDAFSKVISNINIFDEYKKEKKKKYPLIAVNSVISKKNIDYLDEILNAFQQLPINSITFQHLTFAQNKFNKDNDHLLTNFEDIIKLSDFINKIKNKKLKIPVYFFPDIKIRDINNYYNNYNYAFNNSCVFPWLGMLISPQGNIITCTGLNLGNIKDSKINKAWNNSKSKNFRDNLKKIGIFQSCKRCCHRKYY